MTDYPMKWCVVGKHAYYDLFPSCPIHKLETYNVRLRTQFPIFKRPDGGRSNEWTFQQRGYSPKEAGREVIEALFGTGLDREVLNRFVRDIEIWKASKAGISDRAIVRGIAE